MQVLIFVKLTNIIQCKRFLTNYGKNWTNFLRSMDAEVSNFQVRLHFLVTLTLFRMWWGEADPSFSPVTSTNVGFGPQNFLTFSFNSFVTLVQNFKFAPSASPKFLNLNQDHSSKKRFFWSNSYKTEVMLTFLIEMLQLPNFGHMTTSIILFESRDKILMVTS